MSISRLARSLGLSLLAIGVGACGGGGDRAAGDDQAKAKMASDLVQCQNDRSSLKDKIDDLSVELQKLRAANVRQLEEIDLKAQGAPRPAGGGAEISAEALGGVVKRNSGALRACYEKGLKHNPDLQFVSSVKVRFSVRGDGSASGVGFAPRTDGEMEKCMAAAIAKWRFPAFAGDPVQVEAPVNLIAR